MNGAIAMHASHTSEARVFRSQASATDAPHSSRALTPLLYRPGACGPRARASCRTAPAAQKRPGTAQLSQPSQCDHPHLPAWRACHGRSGYGFSNSKPVCVTAQSASSSSVGVGVFPAGAPADGHAALDHISADLATPGSKAFRDLG